GRRLHAALSTRCKTSLLCSPCPLAGHPREGETASTRRLRFQVRGLGVSGNCGGRKQKVPTAFPRAVVGTVSLFSEQGLRVKRDVRHRRSTVIARFGYRFIVVPRSAVT